MNKLKKFLTVSAGFTLLSVLGCVSSRPFVEQPFEGAMRVPGESLTDKLAWLEINADSRNTYIIDVKANENVAPRTFEYEGANNVKIVIRGVGENRTLRLASHGTMFTVRPNVQLILDNNVTIMGHSQNTGPLIHVDGGELLMRKGSRISDNDRGRGEGGGVYIKSGFFRMAGGTISDNTADDGGGVYVGRESNFVMDGGIISGNIANNNGGGVYWDNNERFNIVEGVITDNTARNQGGGVYFNTFGLFRLIMQNSKGAVTGYLSDADNGNAVRDEDGNVLTDRGHAVFMRQEPGYGDVTKEKTVYGMPKPIVSPLTLMVVGGAIVAIVVRTALESGN